MYSIAQFEKVKDASKLATISNHNNRIKLSTRDKARIDTSRTKLNKVVFNPLGISSLSATDTWQKISDFYTKKRN